MAVHHQAAEHVHLGDVELTFFEDIGVEILVLDGDHVVEHHRVDTGLLGGKFAKIGIHAMLLDKDE